MSQSATTIVLGASPDSSRFSYRAVRSLLAHGHAVVAVGTRKGSIDGLAIVRAEQCSGPVDTVTLYLGPGRQEAIVQTLLGWKPRRVIFNPGTENPALMAQLRGLGVEVVEDCTLVMLSRNVY